LLLLADDLSDIAITPAAERWLAEIAETDRLREHAVPSAVSTVVARLQAIEQGINLDVALTPRVRLRTKSGHRLALHASRLLAGASMPGKIAVIFEVARPFEISPLIMQVYDLCKREGEIMQSVLRGLSTREMADTFHIAAYTVQDHLKAIFDKVGVGSRRELVGQLFAQHYQRRIMVGGDLDTSGWFK
jgi:DNA-binding CsgD family transcriptional regulator